MDKQHYNPDILARLRKEKTTQKELAETLGVTEMTIYRAEKGESVSFELLSDICREIGIDVKQILIPTADKKIGNYIPDSLN